jgi:hypothetical protein
MAFPVFSLRFFYDTIRFPGFLSSNLQTYKERMNAITSNDWMDGWMGRDGMGWINGMDYTELGIKGVHSHFIGHMHNEIQR